MRNLKALTLGLALAIVPGAAYAQTNDMSKAESSVQFSKAPAVSDVTDTSATINWSTDQASSGKLQYRPTSGGAWKTTSATASNGQKDFTAKLSGLSAGQTYEYQLLTNSGNVRTSGQFQTSGSSSASANSGSHAGEVYNSHPATDAQEKAEQAVQITQGPTITSITGTSASIKWTTNNVAANQVQYRPVSGGAWKNAYERQGSREHNLQMTGLQPNTTYEYKILTRDQEIRTSGQFQTAASATATMPDVSGSAGTNTAASTGGTADTSGKVALYRAVNSSNGAHVFSTSQGNFPSGFTAEGTAGYLMAMQSSGTTPLYALAGSNGDYFYTADGSERSRAISSLGYADKGIVGYISTSPQSGTVPLYRMLNTSNSHHFYTADANEHAKVLTLGGFKDEGITGYIWQR